MVDPAARPGLIIEAGRPDRGALRLVGLLLVVGFLINLAVTMLWHPSGEEENHPEIFTEYANADGWILTHLGQFFGVMTAIAGLYLLCRLVTSPGSFDALARLAGFAFISAGVCYGILQAVDGIALKYTSEAWLEASGPAQEVRFADAETVRYTEWGVQSYFRIFFGLGLILVGAALATGACSPAGSGGWQYWPGRSRSRSASTSATPDSLAASRTSPVPCSNSFSPASSSAFWSPASGAEPPIRLCPLVAPIRGHDGDHPGPLVSDRDRGRSWGKASGDDQAGGRCPPQSRDRSGAQAPWRRRGADAGL